jgi:hypothetical protein
MCVICNQPDTVRCNCVVTQPFCDQCGDEHNTCVEKIDAQCVIYHFNTDRPSQLTNLGIANNTNLEIILEAIDDLIGNSLNIAFEPVESNSISWLAGGSAGHKPTAAVKISADAGNQAEVRTNGLYVTNPNPQYKVKVNATDAPDYLKNQMVGGTSEDAIVSVDVQDVDGVMQIKPSINVQCLLDIIRTTYLHEFCELVDSCKCFLSIENLVAVFGPACPPGSVLNEAGTLCISEETTLPTISNTVVTACSVTNSAWSNFGAYVYTNGYNTNGTGTLATLQADMSAGNVVAIPTDNVWANPDLNTIDGPMNRAAIWSCQDEEAVGPIGFVVPVNVPTSKVYYIGIGTDNFGQIAIDNTLLVNTALTSGTYYDNPFAGQGIGVKFKMWNIYPVFLTAGIHYITVSGTNEGSSAGGFAAEIYDNTLVELQAAALDPDYVANPGIFPIGQNHYSNLNLVFSTRCARQPGSTFTVGNATCPDSSWTLDATGGTPLVPPCQGINNSTAQWICRRETTSPFDGYNATLVWDRIPNALTYTIQQKLTADPDSAYVDSTGSPLANPGSGTTVDFTVEGLTSDQYTFRVRANFEDCSTEWTIVTGEDSECSAVTFSDPEFESAEVGIAYYVEVPLGGTPTFTLESPVHPDWMTIQIIGNTLILSGTPDAEVTDTPISFTVTNCEGNESQDFEGVLTVLEAPVIEDFAKVSDSIEAICEEVGADAYYEAPLGIGTFLFTNIGLTIPLTGSDYVALSSDNVIYAIDTATGEITGTTGSVCTPP